MTVQESIERFRRLKGYVEKHWIMYSVISITVVLGFYLLISLLGGSGTARDLEEKKAEEALQTLVQMKLQIAEMQRALVEKRDASLRRSSEREPRSRSTEAVVFEVQPSTGFQQVTDLRQELYIPRGSVFQARLVTSIKTALSATVVVGETTRTFEMDSRRKIPAGSRIIGDSQYDPVLQGVIVRFNSLILPKGEEFDGLDLLALSNNAWPQLEGIVFDRSGVEMATALSFGFLSGFSSGAQEREATASGSIPTVSVKNQVLSGLSVASFQVAKDAIERVKSQAVEYVVVPAGTPIFVLFNSKWNLPKGGIKG